MPRYAYKAVDTAGRLFRGQMECRNDIDLASRLGRLGLELIRARRIEPRLLLFRQKIGRREMIAFCFQMEQLTAAGIPLLEGLADLRDSLPQSPLRTMIADLTEAIQGGQPLSAAVARHPQAFTPVMAGLIQAGEASGELPRVFAKLTRSLKWEDELLEQTRRLLIYPAFAGTVVLGVALFLLVYLVPQLAGFIKSVHQALPWPTALLLGLSGFVRNYWYAPPLAAGAAAGAFLLYAGSGTGARLRIDGWKLKTWLLGPILQKIALARFAGFFSLLYAAGVSVLEALRIGEKVAGNRVIAAAIRQARDRIVEGRPLGEAFQSSGIFPPLVLRMLRIGETTGELDKALDNVVYFYDRDVRESIARLQAMLEPAMTIVLGLVLGGIMFAVLGPIYEIIGKFRL